MFPGQEDESRARRELDEFCALEMLEEIETLTTVDECDVLVDTLESSDVATDAHKMFPHLVDNINITQRRRRK